MQQAGSNCNNFGILGAEDTHQRFSRRQEHYHTNRHCNNACTHGKRIGTQHTLFAACAEIVAADWHKTLAEAHQHIKYDLNQPVADRNSRKRTVAISRSRHI